MTYKYVWIPHKYTPDMPKIDQFISEVKVDKHIYKN